jgi:hypothetical protein
LVGFFAARPVVVPGWRTPPTGGTLEPAILVAEEEEPCVGIASARTPAATAATSM